MSSSVNDGRKGRPLGGGKGKYTGPAPQEDVVRCIVQFLGKDQEFHLCMKEEGHAGPHVCRCGERPTRTG